MPNSIRHLLSLFALAGILLLCVQARAQDPSAAPPIYSADEAGLDEKLGETIPLDLVLRDETGKSVVLRELIDKPTILTLNYFRCAGLCSVLLNGVARVINQTQAVPGREFQVVTVSFDERDTFDIAAQKRINYLGEIQRPFPPSAWRFLTGDAKSTRAFADAVGFHYKRVGEDFVHPAAIMFLSPQGRITRYMFGTTYLPADLQMAVQEAARGEARPTVNKWLRFCYSFEPQGRGYVLNVTRIVALILLAAAGAFALALFLRSARGKPVAKESP
jgi:protein SCO1